MERIAIVARRRKMRRRRCFDGAGGASIIPFFDVVEESFSEIVPIPGRVTGYCTVM